MAQGTIAPREQRMGGKPSRAGKGIGIWYGVYDGASGCNAWHGLPAGDAKAGLRSIGGATIVTIDRGRYHRRSSNALSVERDTPQYAPRSGRADLSHVLSCA